MKKLFSVIFFSFLVFETYSQQLSQITFLGGTKLSYFSFLTDQNVLIRVSEDGKVIEWGIEMWSDRFNYYVTKLQPFMGRIEYYGPESDSAFIGKVRSVGTCSFTYYGSYETDNKPGKLRTVGNIFLDYYSEFDDKVYRGKLKLAGSNLLQYYSSFDNEAYRGKLRSVSNTLINYYSTFDDKMIQGKIKTIGTVEYQWYNSFDVVRGGGLKSGPIRQNISGIIYIVQ